MYFQEKTSLSTKNNLNANYVANPVLVFVEDTKEIKGFVSTKN